MADARTIPDDDWAMILRARADLALFLNRVIPVTRDVVDDCISEAVIDLAVGYDADEVRRSAGISSIDAPTVIFGRLKQFASRRLSRERYRSGKLVSDDTPIGDETGDMRLRDLFVPRDNTAERIENYAEWMMLARGRRGPLTPSEVNDLFGIDVVLNSR